MSAHTSRFSWSMMAEKKRQKTRRCLFGPPDPVQLGESLDRQENIFNETGIQRLREKWSFDPETGPIMDGPYEFIAIDPLSDIPAFYRKTYSHHKSRPAPDHTPHTSRPCSAKRKLDLEDETSDRNNENIETLDTFAPDRLDCGLQSLSSELNVSESRTSPLLGSSVDLLRSSSAPIIPVLSPTSRCQVSTTPPANPRSQVQRSMKDYLSNKKQRGITTCQPRT